MTTAQFTAPTRVPPAAVSTVRPVTATAAALSTDAAEPTIDRTSIYVSTILATTIIFFFGVGIPCLIAYNLAWGLGLGGMSAFWGGPAFGVMLASGRVLMAEERLGIHPPHP